MMVASSCGWSYHSTVKALVRMGLAILTIECEPPRRSTCECCGGASTRLTRFVYRDDAVFAVDYAAFSDNHPERTVSVVMSLGEWDDGARPDHTDPRF
jgi:hypothetical protein